MTSVYYKVIQKALPSSISQMMPPGLYVRSYEDLYMPVRNRSYAFIITQDWTI